MSKESDEDRDDRGAVVLQPEPPARGTFALLIPSDMSWQASSRIARALETSGRVYLSQGEFDAAEATLRQCIDATARTLGTRRHASVAALLDLLAIALVQQSKNEEAEALLRESVEVKLEVYGGPAHEEVANSLHGLGEALSRQGKFEEATKIFHASLEALHRATGTEWPADAGPTLQALAMAHLHLGQYAQAEQAWHRKVDLGERLHGTPANSKTLPALGMLAQLCLRRVQRPADALRFSTAAWQAAVAGRQWEHALQLGPVHLACLAGNDQPVEAIEPVVRAADRGDRPLPRRPPDAVPRALRAAAAIPRTERRERVERRQRRRDGARRLVLANGATAACR